MRPAVSPLPWIVHRMLAVRAWDGHAHVVSEAEDWLDLWHQIDADDSRIAYGLWLAIPRCIDFEERPLPRLLWVKVNEDWRNQSVTLTWWWEGGAPQVVGMPELVAVARQLLAADDPPTAPSRDLKQSSLNLSTDAPPPAPPIPAQGKAAVAVVAHHQPARPVHAPRQRTIQKAVGHPMQLNLF